MTTVKFTVELDSERALALAQFLKRVGYSHCHELADLTKRNEPELMIEALETVRHALAEAGYSPR
jgi:hypothetical protein